MRSVISRYGKAALSLLFLTALYLFWWLREPFLLSYHEQYQLFLFTADYLCQALRIPGGMAAWMGEMVVQFFYVEWLGALLLAVLLWLLHVLTARVLHSRKWFLLSFIPPVLVAWMMADESVLLAYPVAMAGAMGCHLLTKKWHWLTDLAVVPLLYWLIGPMVWLYVALQVAGNGWRRLFAVVPAVAVQWVAYSFLLPEWQLYSVLTGWVYYRIPLQVNPMMWIVPLVVLALALLSRLKHKPWLVACEGAVDVALACLAWSAFSNEKMLLIEQDWLVRNEQWDKVIDRAEEHQVQDPFSAQCVNLALAKKRLLADRMFDFYQSGREALIMPCTRDLTSMLPSAEAFWHLGMVNSAQRYMFDTQESILNAKKSGRCTKRIAECMIVNGHYKPAAKQLGLLKHSLFYRQWAKEAETYLGKEDKINAHPVWGKMRKLRYKNDFLYNYDEIDKMFGQLFIGNTDNKMALDYMLAQMLLNGNVPAFSQYLAWAQQYGGYRSMPLVYQDVVNCIRQNGQVQGSPYLNYLQRLRSNP